ncbi:protein kinase family protein [Nocardioides sp.]|uniref:protein kinase family protein n=1 Tax=Nocardioides sp. TaxID=35761 RepID=UPI00356B1008
MPHSVRPGDVLADRYRLIDLLTESGGGRFWRAHDRILERHVALHVISESDERASGLLEAARRSATVLDRRLLRVLDADQVDGLCFVVNEWGQGHSLDVMLAKTGPLAPRRAAWLVSEVAAAIAVAHDTGVAHGRLVPENVLVDRTGSVRVIGFAVDAALHGLPAGRIATDVADLGGLLYCALTGKWPGVSRSDVAPAPHEHGQVLRPRQVRAGIPRPLDALCDAVVNPYAAATPSRLGEDFDLSTARGISGYLADFVGDATGMAEAELLGASTPGQPETVVLTPLSELEAAAQESNGEEDPVEPVTPAGHDQPTQAGMPIFDDEADEVSWLRARSEPAPPPPPFEDPPERPLFAPEPTNGEPVRRPRPGVAATGSQDYWPWGDTGTGTGTGTGAVVNTGTGAFGIVDPPADEVPGRNWLRLAAAVAGGLLLLVAIVVAYNLGRGKTPMGAEPTGPGVSGSPSTSAVATAIDGVTASDFDPQGDPPTENPELAPLAVDDDPSTAWRSLTYKQNFGPGGLKTGLGLTLDLGDAYEVSQVDLALVGEDTEVAVYVTDEAPTTVEGLSPAATATLGTTGEIALDEAVEGRFVTVWLTSVPAVDGGFRGEIADVVVRGS